MTAVISYMGVGIYAGAFLAPIFFKVGEKAHINPLHTFTCIYCGANMGSNFPQSIGGLVIYDLIFRSSYSDQAIQYTAEGAVFVAIISIIMVFLSGLIFRSNDYAVKDIERPEPFTKVQRKTFILICAITLFAAFGSAILARLPAEIEEKFSFLTDIGVLCIVGIALTMLLRLGDERHVMLHRVPWGTIVQLSGVSCLLGVIAEFDFISNVSEMLSGLPELAIVLIIILIAGLMSVFASGITVVCPTLFPLVPTLAASTNIPPDILYAGILAAATVVGSSPFSPGGSTILSGYGNTEDQNRLTYRIFPIPILMLSLTVLCSVIWILLR